MRSCKRQRNRKEVNQFALMNKYTYWTVEISLVVHWRRHCYKSSNIMIMPAYDGVLQKKTNLWCILTFFFTSGHFLMWSVFMHIALRGCRPPHTNEPDQFWIGFGLVLIGRSGLKRLSLLTPHWIIQLVIDRNAIENL